MPIAFESPALHSPIRSGIRAWSGRLLDVLRVAGQPGVRGQVIANLSMMALAGFCAGLGALRYEPMYCEWRDALLAGTIACAVAIMIIYRPGMRRGLRSDGPSWLPRLRMAGFASGLLALLISTGVEANFQAMKMRVLSAPVADLQDVGRHIVVGIDELADVRRLIEKKAISGVFITRRNVKGRNAGALKIEIERLQAVRAKHGGPPLWITADQEGGVVQRLSPPLPKLPPLSRLVARHKNPVALEKAVRDYATTQAKALATIGFNVNFAPVVDVDFGAPSRSSGSSRISQRAISKDPKMVAKVADWYCEALIAAGVRCTRKHFPGLGRVAADTHKREGRLSTAIDSLTKTDWVPFMSPQTTRGDWIMVGHALVTALDPERPASASPAVVKKLREGLGHNGILITDDFGMGAIRKSRLGSQAAVVSALNGGVDLILVSFDHDQVYFVLDALLSAHSKGKLDAARLAESADRLDAATNLLTARR